ncbi:helix-hairpin-helix domain-containing protein [Natrinema gari]|nr:helix-hairpin-helix domain-containing protein [Natrinema gari]
MDISDREDKTGRLKINISNLSEGYTRLTVGEQKFQLEETELRLLEDQASKAVDRQPLSKRPIDHPTRIDDVEVGMDFDERVLFESLIEINRVGEVTALNILEQIVVNTLDELTKEDLIDIDGINEDSVDKIWLYLRGFYDGATE